jgi:hypothetical protein
MAFNQDDLYLASGTGQLLNNWVDPVYKFDSSSFYNWEQDNLPIYDLEDRDDFLHEMAGYPASATAPSIMLTVSDCGIDNKKVFGSVSSAVEALPNTIRQPVIIEVCVSGELGALRLENKEIVASGGGLEIINRGFARMLCGSGAVLATSAAMTNATASSVTTALSVDTSNAIANAFCVGSQTRVGNKHANPWTFFSEFNRTFVLPPEWSKATAQSTKTVAISTGFNDSGSQNALLTTSPYTANIFNVNQYWDNSYNGGEYPDIIVRNPNNNAINNRQDVEFESLKSRVTGYIYANALSDVTVKNCTGRIYVRGFCVDGANQASLVSSGQQRTNIGFDIDGSEVVIENCTATRCRHAGLQAVNSNVTLNRGFVAAMNYELESVGAGFLNQKKESVETPGLKAINSNVTLSSALTANYGCPIDSPYVFTRNMVGVALENSTLTTPTDYRYGLNVAGETVTEVYGSETLMLQAFLNIKDGIRAKESLIDWGGRLASFQNKVGMSLDGATCQVQEATLDHNQEAGLLSTGSVFNYNKNAQAITRTGPFNPLTNFQNNGQHVVLEGSQFIPTSVSAMDTIYERLMFSGSHGITDVGGRKALIPAVDISKASYMNAVCPLSIGLVSQTNSAAGKIEQTVKGLEFSVTDDSTLDLNGTKGFNTFLIGPVDSDKQQRVAGMYAGRNSSINIAGPTTIVQYGICGLAEDNSTIKFSPQTVGGAIDASGWSLYEPLNHTRVQLHSTRASLVANRNSNITMENLGDYHAGWDSKFYAGFDYPTGAAAGDLGTFATSGYFYNGSMQFYANPFTPYSNPPSAGHLNLVAQAAYPTASKPINGDSTTFVQLPESNTGTVNDVSSLSYGGMCVRALGGSTVKANNVIFPAGWTNTSGPYYDASTVGACDHLRIWNIGDSSKLHASYLSVGNVTANGGIGARHPQDLSAAYYGPSALWTSDTGTGLSGAPSSTADTSGASVLDYFGRGVQTGGDLGYYGQTEPQNIGPFRIYVGIDPQANMLGYPVANGMTYMPPVPKANAYVGMGFTFPDDATLITGPPRQLYAQGYGTSGDVSAINNQGANWLNPSAIYPELGASGYITSLPADQQVENVASSFYYPADMLPDNPSINIWLDESAMNTFANAKNGLLDTSGRKKIFSYYKAITESTGEGFFLPTRATGIGSMNLFDLDRYL